MEKKESNWKSIVKRVLFVLFFLAAGFAGGSLLAPYIENITFFEAVFGFFAFVISFPLHIILHELGHIIGGLISGYDFIMFRLFDTVWIKTESGLSKRKEYVPGVMGQALMVPPETGENEQPPVLLYHASGVLMNLFTALLFILLGHSLSPDWLVQFLYVSSAAALILAVMNALPLKGTDGYNILQAFKREEASLEIVLLLKMYQDMVNGASLESLQKYVDFEKFNSFKNPNTTTIYTLRASYLFDIHDFEGSCAIYQTLYDKQNILFQGHQPSVVLNYLYALLLTDPTHYLVGHIIQTKTYQHFKSVKQSDYLRIQTAVQMYYYKDLDEAEALLVEGEQYIPLAPTLTEENFERKQYDYLRKELNRLKAEPAGS